MTDDLEPFLKWGERMMRFHAVEKSADELRCVLRTLLDERQPLFNDQVISKREHFSIFLERFIKWLNRETSYTSHEWLERELYHLLISEDQTFERWNFFAVAAYFLGVSPEKIRGWVVNTLHLGTPQSITENVESFGTWSRYKWEEDLDVSVGIVLAKNDRQLVTVEFQFEVLVRNSAHPEKVHWKRLTIPWSSDVEFARAAHRDLGGDIFCNPGALRAKESLNRNETWHISSSGEEMITDLTIV